MLSYILRRLLGVIPVMVVVGVFVFSLLHLAPGDPAAIIAGDTATQADIARIRTSLGLTPLADRIRSINPYQGSLERLRSTLISACDEFLTGEPAKG